MSYIQNLTFSVSYGNGKNCLCFECTLFLGIHQRIASLRKIKDMKL